MAALALIVAMALVGCAAPPRAQHLDARAAIELLLAHYSTALRSGDAAALRALIAADRSAFLDGQLRLQHDLANLTTDTFEYRLAGDVPSNPVGGHQQWRLDATVNYAVSGVDTVAVQRPLTVGVVRDDATWRVFDATAAAVPWQFGPLVQTRARVAGRGVVILGHPGSAVAARVGDEIDPALRSLQEFWGDDWRTGLMVVATGSDQEFMALVADGHVEGVAAAAVADRVQDGIAVGQRVLFAPGAAAMAPDQFRVVLRHELFHVATRTVTGDRAPLWLVEGVADYNGRRGADTAFAAAAPTLAAALAAGHMPAQLPTDADLDTADARRTQAYEEAWSVAQCVADTFGEPALKRLYLDGAGPAAAPTATAIRQALGVDEDALVRVWQRWLAGRQLR